MGSPSQEGAPGRGFTLLAPAALARREVAAFFRNHPVPSGDRALKQALERFDSWTRFQPVAARELELYLGQK